MQRFINADGYVSTGTGLNGYNMFAYCGNNPVIMVDPTGNYALETILSLGSILVKAFAVVVLVVCAYTILDSIAKNPPSIPLPKPKSKSKSKTEEKDIAPAIPDTSPEEGDTYYHITTPDNAAMIIDTGIMVGSEWEAGYVYAFRSKPNKYAINHSGAHTGVVISFKTKTTFIDDTGIIDKKVKKYGPVVSTRSGPIVVWDVEIVG